MSESTTQTRASVSSRSRRMSVRSLILIICAIVCGLVFLASRSPGFVEKTYAEILGPGIARSLGTVSGLVPLSLAEILIGLVIIVYGVRALFGLGRVVFGKGHMKEALLTGGVSLLTLFAVVVTLFYLLWGIQYARAPLAERMGWTESVGAVKGVDELVELERLCEELLDHVNKLYETTHAGGAAAVTFPPDFTVADQELDACYARVTARLELAQEFGTARAPAKPIQASFIMSHLMLAGFYFPWTGEANYNNEIPVWQRVHSMAHEKAHQRGITSEDEANFFGTLACMASENPYIQYCGYLFAQRQLLTRLYQIDQEIGQALVKKRSAGVQADVDEAREFWKAHAGLIGEASNAINDQFLKANRVKGGIKSYGLSRNLLVLFSRTHKGSLIW